MPIPTILLLLPSRAPGIAAYNLHLLGLEFAFVIELEGDIREVERPHIIAVTIGIQVAL